MVIGQNLVAQEGPPPREDDADTQRACELLAAIDDALASDP